MNLYKHIKNVLSSTCYQTKLNKLFWTLHTDKGHPCGTLAKFFKTLAFLTSWYAHVLGGLEMLVFQNIPRTYQMGWCHILLTINLQLENALGQCYNAKASMAGSKSGVSTKIKPLKEKCLYTHCHRHLLNLPFGDLIKSLCLENGRVLKYQKLLLFDFK